MVLLHRGWRSLNIMEMGFLESRLLPAAQFADPIGRVAAENERIKGNMIEFDR